MTKTATTTTDTSAPAELMAGLVGHWHSSGHVLDAAETTISGTDTYAWLPGRVGLIHFVDVWVGTSPVRAVELITPTADRERSFSAVAFDSDGTITRMTAEVDGNLRWLFRGGGDVASAAAPDGAGPTTLVRSTLTAESAQLNARWERALDGSTWRPWMDMTFIRDADIDPADWPPENWWASGPSPTVAGPLRALDTLTGSWNWHGAARDGAAREGGFAVSGSTRFRWLPGGAFLMEAAELRAGNETNCSIAMVGWDDARGGCVAHYCDNDGVVATYELAVADGTLRVRWPGYRFAGRFSPDSRTVTGPWEQLDDCVGWRYWYDATLQRTEDR